ncbi:hypothetical protein DL95DRAFT_463961 [Leptodontidium sp. 2 PMI_412]|nr:hypothetical protein DL95DRAFT_463961 [Leptodontidium sp. 2 PMI_412]
MLAFHSIEVAGIAPPSPSLKYTHLSPGGSLRTYNGSLLSLDAPLTVAPSTCQRIVTFLQVGEIVAFIQQSPTQRNPDSTMASLMASQSLLKALWERFMLSWVSKTSCCPMSPLTIFPSSDYSHPLQQDEETHPKAKNLTYCTLCQDILDKCHIYNGGSGVDDTAGGQEFDANNFNVFIINGGAKYD